MATSQVINLAANRAASNTRTGGPKGAPRSNRFVAFFVGIVDVLREARELELRTLGAGRYRRLGES